MHVEPVESIALILLGALAGGFVSGLAGFGTGITALGIWLYALSPSVAATLVIVCSVSAQLQTLPKIWHTIEIRRVAPFIIPGLLGIPIGTTLLASVDVRVFKLTIGGLLIAFALHALVNRSKRAISWGGRIADAWVGLGGGILGGLAGLSGVLPTMWADVRGWSKAQRRSIFQVFNLSILSAALVAHAIAGLITRDLVLAAAFALPGTFVGSWTGYVLYTRLSDKRFKEIILALLCISGVLLIWTNI
ncbi:MAG: sulfite exporter TauE/SafE family protein [Pseudomonadota bacterium]